VPYRIGWGIVEALGTPEKGVTGAVIAPLDNQWRPLKERARQITCDTICIGYGFIPETVLSRLAGAKCTYKTQLGGWVPIRDHFFQTAVPGLYAVGDGAGVGGAMQSELEGQIAGTVAASLLLAQENRADLLSNLRPIIKKLDQQRAFQRLYGRLFTPRAGIHTWAEDDTILCRCENVKRKTVETAVTLGAHTLTAVKGLTRVGMGACQGRLCSHLIAGQIAQITGKSISACGQFNPRAPIYPYPIGDAITEGEGA
jgi:NAD(P)H-nitrite reductase large subunit